MTMNKPNAELNRLYAETEQLKISNQEMQQQLNSLTFNKRELLAAKDTLEELTNHGTGDPLLISIGGGIQLQVKIDQIEEVLVNIGSGVHLNMKPKEILQRIEEHLKSVEENISRAYQSLNYLNDEILQREQQMQQLTSALLQQRGTS